MAVVGSLLIEMSANVARLQKDMASARSTVSQATKGINSAINTTQNLLGTLGIAFSAVQVARFAKSIIDDADAMGKLAQKTNMAVEQVAGWSHALDLAGVSQDALLKTAKALGTQMLDASRGSAEAQSNFAALDIGIKNNDGSLKSVNAVLLEVADRYARATDKTAAAALMNKVLGKSALDLIPAFKDGRAALEAMIEEDKRLNPITEESARQAEQFNDNVTRLSKSIKSGFIVSMNNALPRMVAISDEFVRNANEGNKLLAVLKAIAQLYQITDPALITQQKELIALAERREEINTNIERLRAKGPQWADPVAQQMAELAKLDARAKALSAMIDPVNPRNYDARDLALVGNKPAFTPKVFDEDAAKKAIAATKKAAAEMAANRAEQLYLPRVAAEKELREAAQERWEIEKEADAAFKRATAEFLSYSESQNELLEQQAQHWKDIIDPLEPYLRQLTQLDKLLAEGKLTSEEWSRAVAHLAKEMDSLNKVQTEAARFGEKLDSIGRDLGLTFSSAFEDAVVQGKNLRDVLAGIEQDMARVIARKTVTEPLGDALSKGLSFGSGWLSGLFGSGTQAAAPVSDLSFGGAMAGGGDFMVTKPTLFLAGEAGPERATFSGANQTGSGGATVVNITLNAIDTRSGVQFLAANKDAIGAIVNQAFLRGGRRSGMTL